MTHTVFVDDTTVITASWLNDVDTSTYTTVPANTTAISAETTRATNAENARPTSATLAAAGGAALIGNTPAGNIASTTVQAALNELDTKKLALNQVPYPYRNRLINSDMSVNQIYNPTQAASGTAVTPTANAFVTDQWTAAMTQASKLTFQQVSDAPAGLKYSTKISVASQYSPLATDAFGFYQNIEGQNIIDFQLGAAGAVTIITSQWIKGSVAGTYTVALSNSASNRSYVGTINVTTSWQRLSINLVGDITGTWLTDNTIGLAIWFDLGSGSNFNTTAGSWQAGNFKRTAGSVTFVNQVAGSTLNITGVQVEKGVTGQTNPTDFEVLAYEEQLRRAQRYLPVINGASNNFGYSYSATNSTITVKFSVVTRVPITGLITSSLATFILFNGTAGSGTPTSLSISSGGVIDSTIDVTTTAGSPTLTSGQGAFLRSGSTAQIIFTGAQL